MPSVQHALDAYLATVKRFVARTASVRDEAAETIDVRASLDEVLKPIRLPDDPVAASYAIAGLLQIELTRKQQLLELPDAAARLRAELELLRRESACSTTAPCRRSTRATSATTRTRPMRATRLGPISLAAVLLLAACGVHGPVGDAVERPLRRLPSRPRPASCRPTSLRRLSRRPPHRRRPHRSGRSYIVQPGDGSRPSLAPTTLASSSFRPGTRVATRRSPRTRMSSSRAGSSS